MANWILYEYDVVNVGSSIVKRRIIFLGDFVEVGSNIWDISVTFLLFSYEPKTVLKIKSIFLIK